jgi:uncharacterized metal-binding protein YceD (DUF177 family)
MISPWSIPVRLPDVGKSTLELTPEPDAATRARIAEVIGVDALNSLQVRATLKSWLDGVELCARFEAEVVQTCGVSLDPFDVRLAAEFVVRALPPGSPNAPEESAEAIVDPEGDDPPEVLEGETIDVGAYVVEHLALEVDPFPRKPGAVFEQPGGVEIISPFAGLSVLKDDDKTN